MPWLRRKLSAAKIPRGYVATQRSEIRGLVYQVVVFASWRSLSTGSSAIQSTNLRRANIASGFGFLNGRAGFDVSQSLIEFSSDSTYRPGIARRFSQHALCRGHRHRHRLDRRLPCRHRPAVAQLADLRRSARSMSSCSATSRRCSSSSSGISACFRSCRCARQHRPAIRQLPEQPRLFLPRFVWGDGAWLIGAFRCWPSRCLVFVARRAQGPAAGDRPAVPGPVDLARDSDWPAAARLRRHGLAALL
jgi:hypothetical protein